MDDTEFSAKEVVIIMSLVSQFAEYESLLCSIPLSGNFTGKLEGGSVLEEPCRGYITVVSILENSPNQVQYKMADSFKKSLHGLTGVDKSYLSILCHGCTPCSSSASSCHVGS